MTAVAFVMFGGKKKKSPQDTTRFIPAEREGREGEREKRKRESLL